MFPANEGDWWIVRDGRGRVVEEWRVDVPNNGKGHFRALIIEHVPEDNS